MGDKVRMESKEKQLLNARDIRVPCCSGNDADIS